MGFIAGNSGGHCIIWVSNFHLLSTISMDNGLVPEIWYSFLFIILWGHRIPVIVLSFESFRDNPHLPLLYSSLLLPVFHINVILSFV